MFRRLEFAWDGPDERNPLPILIDCHNLEQLHIGLHHCNIEDIREYNISKNTNVDIWRWKQQGTYMLRILCHLPCGPEVKIRELPPVYFTPEWMSHDFEGPTKRLYKSFIIDDLVEKFEAKLKERLRGAWLRVRRNRQRKLSHQVVTDLDDSGK